MIKYLVVAFLLIELITAQKHPRNPAPPTWLTLTGKQPDVIARGGFSGLFPDSSRYAYDFVSQVSLPDSIYYCDLQLTKDGVGFCQTELNLDNSTNIANLFPKGQKTYNVNGKDMRGWFAIDYFADQLLPNLTSVQNVLTRPNAFDGQQLLIVEDVTSISKPPPRVWLNVQYDLFYNQHKISPALYLQDLRFAGINYISSPEIGFLKSIGAKVDKVRTKLVLRFLEPEAIEPTTNQAYGEILKNLAAIKPFASGILVPKTYIWPVNKDMYLMPPSTLVTDAHKQGLEVYASGFANDFPGSYNYSYDPTAEYLQFIDNGQFSVDGVLTDFAPTASEAIACLAHNKNASKPKKGHSLIISHNGASGDYAGCTDLAYEKAVMDGADIIDCSVQMSKDGVAFCLDSADLLGDTTAITTFMSRSSNIPEIQPMKGIFSFDLTWSEIRSLKPQLTSPLSQDMGGLPRNPANKNKGKFLTLAEFLNFAKAEAVTGVLINIQNAPYLASKKGLDIVGAVTTALSNATFDKQSTQQVMIQSDDTSVLAKFKEVPSYHRVYDIMDIIGDAPKPSVDEIKKYADAVDVRRPSIFKSTAFFLSNFTKVVEEMHAANISVHVSPLYNEYTTLAFDFFADPLVELATLIEALKVDAVVTDYPATANAYLRSPCSDPRNTNLEYPISPVEPGALLEIAAPQTLPPSGAPAPALEAASIVDPPLPPVSKEENPAAPAPADQKKSESGRSTTSLCLSLVLALALSLILTVH
ncbi:glycerophosphodiester phosphodiesterase GDPDL7-like [Chenopodium quinoa]|uniref:glycerophosphodiester phosphodiesterase GDPDL7-like n=1 Tax=Chenopodium quinoa TaxID=63459 RepID=UPI000B78A871|nr:glycerophosphodiester phosphodiesterase GDPDL7-like [Chenopodium quinoa]